MADCARYNGAPHYCHEWPASLRQRLDMQPGPSGHYAGNLHHHSNQHFKPSYSYDPHCHSHAHCAITAQLCGLAASFAAFGKLLDLQLRRGTRLAPGALSSYVGNPVSIKHQFAASPVAAYLARNRRRQQARLSDTNRRVDAERRQLHLCCGDTGGHHSWHVSRYGHRNRCRYGQNHSQHNSDGDRKLTLRFPAPCVDKRGAFAAS